MIDYQCENILLCVGVLTGRTLDSKSKYNLPGEASCRPHLLLSGLSHSAA